jgi:poly-gamma-glutamate synthesis protein (capsule biosynthesis protein)
MILKKIAFSVCLVVVLLQLTSIAFVLPIPQFSYGALMTKAEEVAHSFSKHIAFVRMASNDREEYESVVFVGDILLARNVEQLMNRKGHEYPFMGLNLSSLAYAPAIIGNFESSMANPHTPVPAYTMRFSVSESFIPALKNAGFTHLSLANNHSLDHGEEGFENAFKKLSNEGFSVFGHGNTITEDSIEYIKTTNGTIAIIGIHASARVPSEEELEEVFEEAGKHSDMQIVYIHWGAEYILTHHRTQEAIATQLVSHGADLIIGHHPHVVQDIDLIDSVVVVYSLGNYIFDQYFSNDVQEGLVAILDTGDSPSLLLLPVTSANTLSQPTAMSPESHAVFLKKLAERSHPDLQEAIVRGVVPLSRSVATSTEMAIMMR